MCVVCVCCMLCVERTKRKKKKKSNKRNTNETKLNNRKTMRCDDIWIHWCCRCVVSWRRHIFHLVASFRRVALSLSLSHILFCRFLVRVSCGISYKNVDILRRNWSIPIFVGSCSCRTEPATDKMNINAHTHTWQKWQNRQIGRKAMCNNSNSEQLQCTKCTALHTAHSNEHAPSTVFLRSFNSYSFIASPHSTQDRVT